MANAKSQPRYHSFRMTAATYDEHEAIRDYLEFNARVLMTEFERRCLYLAIKRHKAQSGGSAADKLPRWLAEEEPDVVQVSLDGEKVIRQRIDDRIARNLKEGRLVVARCPECHRIVRTPFAKQCLWCGHDWHNSQGKAPRRE